MALCERVLQPLWHVSMADSFSVFKATARRGAHSNSALALQPLSPSFFESALADLHSKSTARSPLSARIDANNRRANSHGCEEAIDGATLALSLLHEFQSNTKLLDPLASSMVAAVAVNHAAACNLPHADSSLTATSSNLSVTAPTRVPPLNLSRIKTEAFRPTTLVHFSEPATALTAQSEWLRRSGQTTPVRKPLVPVDNALSLVERSAAPRSDSDAVLEVELLLRNKQHRMQELSPDAVALQYRSLKCPSPDIGYRIVFNGSSNFNMFRPFDAVRIVSARSSRTILNRSVAPLSERQMPTRRPHHGQYISYREDFFDEDSSRAATRSSRRHTSSARSANSGLTHRLQAKLDALESDALNALNATFVPRHPATAARATFAISTLSPVTEVSHAPTIRPSPPLTPKAVGPLTPPSARVRKASLMTADTHRSTVADRVGAAGVFGVGGRVAR
jgi:hypothetical protein